MNLIRLKSILHSIYLEKYTLIHFTTKTHYPNASHRPNDITNHHRAKPGATATPFFGVDAKLFDPVSKQIITENDREGF